jgi:hypothetical protein
MRLLPMAAVLTALVVGAMAIGSLTSTPASADLPGDCTVDGVSPACTSWSIDAIPGGAVDVLRPGVGIGSCVPVDILVDLHTGTNQQAYQVNVAYDDVALDACGIPSNWGNAPTGTTGGNLHTFASGALCDPSPSTNAVSGEDDSGTAQIEMTCAESTFGQNSPAGGVKVRFFFLCEAASTGVGSSGLLDIGDFNVTYIIDEAFANNNDHDHTANIQCVTPPTFTPTFTPAPATNTFTPTATHTFTNTFTPSATPAFSSATMDKIPLGGESNVIVTGNSIPLANLFLCEPDEPVNEPPEASDGYDGECDGPNEGEVQWIESGFSPVDPIGAFEFQIKFDHKIFDINLECVTTQDPGPVCTGDEDEDNTLNTDADTWDIQLSDQLKNGGDGREWGMDKCFRNVTENYINFACTSIGDPGEGFFGEPTDLAVVTVHPDEDLKFRLRPGNDNGIVRVILDENCELVDPVGHPVTGSIAGGLTTTCGDIAITVRILEGDLNLNCFVGLDDAQAIAQLYGMVFGLFLYDPWYDLEPNITDFDIDAKDLQKVFGRIDSTCQNPVPPQPPIAPPQA